MSITRIAARLATRMLHGLGVVAISRSTADEIVAGHPWLADRLGSGTAAEQPPPTPYGSVVAPSENDPQLADLRRRYAGHAATSHSARPPGRRMDRFRDDDAYLRQSRDATPVQYLLSAYYVRGNDALGLLDRLAEDAAFGAPTVQHEGRTISRDLLESVLEINFLEEAMGLSRLPELSVLDIGAGYGRLGHRMAESVPNLERYICTDAVPESTFLSGFYARHRGVDGQVKVAALDEIEALLARTRVDIALNIHSFSECSLSSIEYWLDLVARAKVPWLFIVADTGDQLVSCERDKSRRDFRSLIEARGYELSVKRPKYHRSPELQQFGLFPSTYFLFLRGDMHSSGQYRMAGASG